MAIPPNQYDPRRLFVFSCPTLPFSKYKRGIGVYVAGGLVSFFTMITLSAYIFARHTVRPSTLDVLGRSNPVFTCAATT